MHPVFLHVAAGAATSLLCISIICMAVGLSAQWGQAAGLAVLALAVCARAK